MQSVNEEKVYVDFFACHIKNNNSQSYPIHFHEHIEIYLLVSGGKECFINNKFYKIHDGDILIFKPNQIHRLLRDDNKIFERYIMEINPYYLADSLVREEWFFINNYFNGNEVIIFSPTDEERKNFIKLFSEYLKVNYQNPDPTLFHSSLRRIKFLEMFIYVITILKNHNKAQNEKHMPNSMINPILDYLEKNYINSNLTSVAKHFNISKNYLCVLFKKNMSMTINNYILSKKIVMAKNLLAEGKNVTQVTELCGFNDTTDFARVFKKYTNTSPKKYQLSLKIWK